MSSAARGTVVTVAACVLAALCEGFDLQAAGVAAAGLVAEFRPGPDRMGTFFSASTIGLFLGALIGGRLSDTLGRKGLLVGSVAAFGMFSIATSRAGSVDSLIVWRLLTGFGLGGAFPVLVALVNERSSPRRRRANVALAYSAMPFGGAVVSLMSLEIAPAQWRAIFLVGGVVPLLSAPLMVFAVRDRPTRAPSGDAALSSLGDGLRDGPGNGGGKSRAASGAAPARATRESDTEGDGGHGRVRFAEIFREGRALSTALLWLASFLGLLILYLLLSWLPTLLVDAGFTTRQASGAQVAFNIGGAVVALILGQLLESRARYPALVVTFIAAPSLVFWLSRAPSDFLALLGITFALGGAVVAIQGYLYAAGALVYPTRIRGAGMGAAVAVGRTGSIVGPKLGGALKGAGHGPHQLMADVLPLVVLGSIAALLFTWRIARRATANDRG